MGLVNINVDKCVGCNACIRTCPAPEANHTTVSPDGTSITTIVPDKCIACGECIRTCQHGARYYEDDVDEFFKALDKGNKIALLVTPSFKTAFPETWRGILDWLRTKGVSGIYDVSYGADICSWAHMKYVENNSNGEKIITQPCAAIVNYIKKYRTELLVNLSPVHSPIGCEAVYLRNFLHIHNEMAALTPCIAKKSEFEETGHVKYNVTFKRLQEYLKKENVRLKSENFVFTYDFDDQQGTLGSVYPRPGGLRDNLWFKDSDLDITTSEGVNKVYPELDMYAEIAESKRPDIFDVLSCEFGCNTGPASGDNNSIFAIMSVMRDVEHEAKKNRRGGSAKGLFGADKDKLYKNFDYTLNYNQFLRVYEAPRQKSYEPKEEDLDSIFIAMGKVTTADRHYDCHACGYKSCRQMATAIYRGLNVPGNCIVNAKSALTKRYKEVEKVSASVSQFANKLTADIENIYASLLAIDDKNQQAQKYTGTVGMILKSIIDTCNSSEGFDMSDIAQLSAALQKMKDALKIMDNMTTETTSNSSAIREGMEEVANATMELSRMVDDLVNSFESKY